MGKKRKKLMTLDKMLESLKKIKPRIPTPPTGTAFKSVKDYDRKSNKKIIKEETE